MEITNWWKNKKQNNVVMDAQSRYQAIEYNGEIWLTFQGCLIAPFGMITKNGTTEEITSLLGQLRQMYIERNT